MEIEIRPITDDERVDWIRAEEAAFGYAPQQDEIDAMLPVIEADRSFAAREDGRIVGASGAVTLRMVVPGGGRVPTAGVTMVGVLPTHRRRGINTRLMATLLDQAIARGEPLAALFASQGGIYGRFGYGIATLLGEFQAEAARMDFVRGYEPRGHVELLPKDEAMPLIDRVYSAALRPGGMERSEKMRAHVFATVGEDKDRPWFYAIHRDARGKPDGYAVYWAKEDWTRSVPSGTVTVRECLASTPSGYADIWRFLFDLELVASIEAWNRPADEPLLQLVREPRRLRFSVNDGLWVRVLDVVSALEARRYGTDGRIVFEVADPFRPTTDGRYELSVEGGAGRCTKTEADADLSGTINILGAAYLGGSSFRQLWWAAQVEERTPGALDRADAMFASTPAPWCVLDF